MSIIRSSRVLYKWLLPVVFVAWFSSCRYGVELRVVCPVCGRQDESRLQTALIRHTVLYCTESDDTRCCDDTIRSPKDGHVNARNMSRIIV